MEELVSALRTNAEAVLRGISALQDRCLKEGRPHEVEIARELPSAKCVQPPVAKVAAECSHQSSVGGSVRFAAPAHSKPALSDSPAKGSDLKAGGLEACIPRVDRRGSLTSWLQVPPALENRWGSRRSSPSPNIQTRTTSRSTDLVLQLDSRWRDLFVSNELELDAEEESVLSECMGRKSSRRTSNVGLSLGLPIANPALNRGPSFVNAVAPLAPHGTIRIGWDMIGLLFMLYDFITIPIYFCWDIQPSGFAVAMVAITAVFWSFDIFMNFNTGFFSGGVLEMSRRAVILHYMRTWFVLDMSVVLLDILILADSTSALRNARAIRVLRLARIAKISKLNQAIEDVCASFGIRWVILVIAILRNLAFIFLLAHMAACSWYYIGRLRSDQNLPGWLDTVDPDGRAPSSELYVRSLYWVLGHLTAAPVDPDISARSHVERTFTLSLIFCSLLVLGAGISSMTNTIAELSKLNSDFIETKRQLQSYLKAAAVNRELSTRIIQFALHSYTRRCALSLDAGVLGLLSERLKSELAVNQRSKYFLVHPLFGAVRDNFQEVFRDVCETFKPNVYADGDVIFMSGRVAKCMYVTHQGSFRMHVRSKDLNAMAARRTLNSSVSEPRMHSKYLRQLENMEDLYLEDPEWISEVALYTKFVHQCTLQAVSFADAFTFSCQELLNCVSMSPKCVGFVYRYAQEFVATAPRIQRSFSVMPLELLSLGAAREVFDTMQKATQPLTSELESPDADFDDTRGFLQQLKSNTRSTDELCDALPRVFKELDSTSGLFAKLAQMDERGRAICSMLSVVLLVKNRYEDFVAPQSEAKRLSTAKWQEWQFFVQWVDITDEQLHAALVFLAIRGFGKMKSLTKALPADARAPEDVVLHLMDNVNRIVPSVSQLSDEMQELVQQAFMASKNFSLPQLLQGENTPSQVQLLKNAMETQGETLLKFLLICQVGVMCGLMGARVRQGSTFMDEANSTNILAAVSFLRMAGGSAGHAVYWGYILSRGRRLGLPTEEQEEIAVCRLACLCRTSPAEAKALQGAWTGLSVGVRRALMDNLLADGINEMAFVFAFLPMYLANAKANNAVGLQRALLVLVDLLEVLRAEGCVEEACSANIVVDLQEMASFAKDASNPRVFQATPAHVKLVQNGSEVQILIATKHKERVKLGTWAEDQEFDMPAVLRKLERKIDFMESYIAESGVSARHESHQKDTSDVDSDSDASGSVCAV